MVQYSISTIPDCNILYRSRRAPVDAGWQDGISALHAADAMWPTRTQVLSSAEKKSRAMPLGGRAWHATAVSHGCHILRRLGA